MVQSFPHAPDVFALLKQLAAVTGETPFAQQDLSGSNRRHSDNPSGTVKFPAQVKLLFSRKRLCSVGKWLLRSSMT